MGSFQAVLAAPQFARPANTTQYAAGDLVADNATGASVIPLIFPRGPLRGKTTGKIIGGRMRKSAASTTTAGFKLHLFNQAKTLTNGDNGAIVVNSMAGYIGSLLFDFTAAAALTPTGNTSIIGGAIELRAVPSGVGIAFKTTGNIYGYLEATAAYTPASGETIDVSIDIEA